MRNAIHFFIKLDQITTQLTPSPLNETFLHLHETVDKSLD